MTSRGSLVRIDLNPWSLMKPFTLKPAAWKSAICRLVSFSSRWL